MPIAGLPSGVEILVADIKKVNDLNDWWQSATEQQKEQAKKQAVNQQKNLLPAEFINSLPAVCTIEEFILPKTPTGWLYIVCTGPDGPFVLCPVMPTS